MRGIRDVGEHAICIGSSRAASPARWLSHFGAAMQAAGRRPERAGRRYGHAAVSPRRAS